MSELKPCPFCGSEAQVNTWTMHGITESRCFCSNSDCPNSVRTVALEQWNNRPIEDALNARIIEVTNLYLQTKDAFDVATEILLKQDARIAELEAEIDIRKDQQREAKNILVDKKLHIDSLYEESYKLQQRIAELEAFIGKLIKAGDDKGWGWDKKQKDWQILVEGLKEAHE